MTMVGIADLKARLSEYLDLVKSGEELVVTERGAPIATVSRIPASGDDLDQLVRSGVVHPPNRPLTDDFFDRPRPDDQNGSTVEALLEERHEGR